MREQETKENIQQFIEKRMKEENTINAMMEMKFLDYDVEQKCVRLSFPVHSWQLNPVGHMHGGLLCTALDITMGCAAYSFTNSIFTPTIQMAVNFVSSIHEHDVLIIEGICDHAGSRMAQVRAIARVEGKKDIVATAHGSYAVNTRR